MSEDQEHEFNYILKSQQGGHDSEDAVNNFMKSRAIAAEHTMPDNQGYNRKQECDPEIFRPINVRKDIIMRGDDDNIKEITNKQSATKR